MDGPEAGAAPPGEEPPRTVLCMLCQVTVLPAGRRLCYRCWRMMRPDERRAVTSANGGSVPDWVDRGHD